MKNSLENFSAQSINENSLSKTMGGFDLCICISGILDGVRKNTDISVGK